MLKVVSTRLGCNNHSGSGTHPGTGGGQSKTMLVVFKLLVASVFLTSCPKANADATPIYAFIFAGAAAVLPPNFMDVCNNWMSNQGYDYSFNVMNVTTINGSIAAEPQNFADAMTVYVQFNTQYLQLLAINENPGVIFIIGTYSPYLAGLVQNAFNGIYYVVGANDGTMMQQDLINLYYQSQIQFGQGNMPASIDFNGQTRVVNDTIYLYNAILQIVANIQSPIPYFQNISISNIVLVCDDPARVTNIMSWTSNNPTFNMNPFSMFTIAISDYASPNNVNNLYTSYVRPVCNGTITTSVTTNATTTCVAYDIVYQMKMSNAELIIIDLSSDNQNTYLPSILYMAQWLGMLSYGKVWVLTNNVLPLKIWIPYTSTQTFFVFLSTPNMPTDPQSIICQDAVATTVNGSSFWFNQYRYSSLTYVESTFVITQYFYGNIEASQYATTYFNNTSLNFTDVSLVINTWTGQTTNATASSQNNSTAAGCAPIVYGQALLNATDLNRMIRISIVIEEPFVFRNTSVWTSALLNNGTNPCVFISNVNAYQGFYIDILKYLMTLYPKMQPTLVEVPAYCPTVALASTSTTSATTGTVPSTVTTTTKAGTTKAGTTTTAKATTAAPAPSTSTICNHVNTAYSALGLGGLLQTTTTLSYMSASIAVISDVGVTVLMRNDTADHTWDFLQPLSDIVWIALLLSIILLTCTYVALDKIAPNNPSVPVFSWLDSLWYTFGSFTFANAEVIPTRVSSRIMSIVMWFSAIVVVSSYTAGFATSLVNPTPSTGISDVTSLITSSSLASQFKYGILQSGIAMEMIKALNSSTPIVASMWNNLVQFSQSQPSLTFQNSFNPVGVTCLNTSSCGANWVYIGDENLNAYWSYKYCSAGYMVQGQPYWSAQYIIGVPPSANYYTQLNKYLTTAFQNNVIQTFYNNWFAVTCTQLNIPGYLTVSQMAGMYYVYAAAMGLSVLVALIQFLMIKLKMQRQRVVWKDFTFGKDYSAKVINITNEGTEIVLDARKDEAFLMLNRYLNPKATTDVSPQQKGITVDSKILVKYLGYDPETSRRMFLFSRFIKDKKKKK